MSGTRTVLRHLIERLPGTLGARMVGVAQDLRVPALRRRRAEHRRILAAAGSPDRILGGPFREMRYLSRAWGSQLLPKFAGTYERELHATIESLIAREPALVVDIGAAEGYYAVGLARRLPRATIVAFDTSPASRGLLNELARRNACGSRLVSRGAATPRALRAELSSGAGVLVIVDCEGYEDAILDPALVEGLRRATLLVETHESLVPGVSQRIRDRFASTHRTSEIAAEPRKLGDLPEDSPFARLPDADALEAMNEYRVSDPPQSWLLLVPIGR